MPCASIDEVFHATSAGAADFGVVPVENSSEGVVTRSLDLFLTTPLFIIGETSLYVRHNLLRRENSQDGIEVVCAHPQALAQCHDWLGQHLPRRRAAAGREQCRRSPPGQPRQPPRGIASTRAASEFGLHIVAPAIQDDAHNRTRFAVIAHPQPASATAASGNDCTSLVVSVPNRPGAVHDLLGPLKTHGVSMTRFESRPGALGTVGVLLLHRSAGSPRAAASGPRLQELRSSCAFFKVLGTYPIDSH